MNEIIMIILTTIYVIATIVICFFSYKTIKVTRAQTTELRKQYEEENRPYITIEMIYERRKFYGIRLINHGKKIANNVLIDLDQSFIDSITEQTFKSLLEKEKDRKCIIGIGQSVDLFFGSNEFRTSNKIKTISGQVTYSNGDNQYKENIDIDFERYSTFFSILTDSDDLLSQIKKQTGELNAINDNLNLIATSLKDKK